MDGNGKCDVFARLKTSQIYFRVMAELYFIVHQVPYRIFNLNFRVLGTFILDSINRILRYRYLYEKSKLAIGEAFYRLADIHWV